MRRYVDFIHYAAIPNPVPGGNLWMNTDGQLYLEDEPVTVAFVTKNAFDSLRTESEERTTVLGVEQYNCVYTTDSLPTTITGNLTSCVLLGARIARNVTGLNRCILIGTSIMQSGTVVPVNRQIIIGDFWGLAGNFNGGGANGNIVLGWGIGPQATSADANVIQGHFSCPVITSATGNTIIGANTCASLTSGTNNCAFGSFALGGLQTGTGNVAIGVGAGSVLNGANSNNVCISNVGVAGDNGRIRIGTSGTHTTCFVQGISEVNIGPSPQVRVNASGQLGVQFSSLKYKQNVQDLTDTERIYALRPVTFEYKDFPGLPCFGLIAEETFDVYPELACCGTKEKLKANVETVDYEKLYIAMLKEMQKLKVEVDNIKLHLNIT